VLYGRLYPVRIRAEGAVGISPDRHHLYLAGHLPDELGGAFGDPGTVGDENEADHLLRPQSAGRGVEQEVR
jgi:hypothetical protein